MIEIATAFATSSADVEIDAWTGLTTRRSVPPAMLRGKGPSRCELLEILSAASRVPDHGMLVPWRFIIVTTDQSAALCERLCKAYASSDGAREAEGTDALFTMQSRLRTWLVGPPVTVVLVSCADRDAAIPEHEQLLAGAAVATTLLHATAARGFGSIWLTGWPAYGAEARAILGVRPDESVIGLFPIGTPSKRPAERPRPQIADLVSDWVG